MADLDRKLSSNMPRLFGDDVDELHVLLGLLYPGVDLDKSADRHVFGPKAVLAVKAFQAGRAGLDVTGQVGADTMAALREAVAALSDDDADGAPEAAGPAAPADDSRRIAGTVRGKDGMPVADAWVKVWDINPLHAKALGTVQTDADGRYEVRYLPADLPRGKPQADLFVRRVDAEDDPFEPVPANVLGSGQVRRSAGAFETIDLEPPAQTRSEFDRLDTRIRAILEDNTAADLNDAQIDLAAAQAGTTSDRVWLMLRVNELAKELGNNRERRPRREALFGLLSQGIDATRDAILGGDRDVWAGALERAKASGDIAADVDIDDQLAKATAGRHAAIAREPSGPLAPRIAPLLNAVLTKPQWSRIAKHLDGIDDDLDAVIERVAADRQLKDAAARLRLASAIRRDLAVTDPNAVAGLLKRGRKAGGAARSAIAGLRDLASLKVDDIEEILRPADGPEPAAPPAPAAPPEPVAVPVPVPMAVAADADAVMAAGPEAPAAAAIADVVVPEWKSQARALAQTIERRYPTTALGYRAGEDDLADGASIAAFLAAHGADRSDDEPLPDDKFDIAGPPLRVFLERYPEAKAALGEGEGATVLGRIQHLRRAAPDYAGARAIMRMKADRDTEVRSTDQIVRMGRNRFAAEYATARGGREYWSEGQAIYAKAEQDQAMMVAMVAELSQKMRVSDDENFSAWTEAPPAVKKLPNWELLFGSEDSCACKHCSSIFGLGAYFVDILHDFLGRRRIYGGDLSARDILLSAERRSDLKDIELTCDNAELRLPYVDLALELMEDEVVLRHPACAAKRHRCGRCCSCGPCSCEHGHKGARGVHDERDEHDVRDEAAAPPFRPRDLDMALAKDLDAGNLTEALKCAFDPPLTDDAVVHVRKEHVWWTITEPAFAYTVQRIKRTRREDAGEREVTREVLQVTARGRQTFGTTEDLQAQPQYLNPHAYDVLRCQVYPWTQPFDLWLEEVRTYLGQFKVKRWDLNHKLRSREDLLDPADKARVLGLATEYLGLSKAQRQIITGQFEITPPCGCASGEVDVWQYYGFADSDVEVILTALEVHALKESVLLPRTKLTPFEPVTLPWHIVVRFLRFSKSIDVEDPEADTIPKRVARTPYVFGLLDRARLTHDELVALLRTEFINPDGDVTISSNGAPDSCDTTELILQIPCRVEAFFDRLHRFVRLWRALGWSPAMVDLAIRTLGGDACPPDKRLDDAFIVRLAQAVRVKELLDLEPDQALAFWSDLDTSGNPSLYARLFADPAVSRQIEPAFRLDRDPRRHTAELVAAKAAGGPPLLDALPQINASLGLVADDLIALAKKRLPAGATLNLANLSSLYRHATLAKALDLSIESFLKLIDLSDIDPFDGQHIELTLRFITIARRMADSGFTIDELDYVLRHRFEPRTGVAPDDDTIALVLTELRKGLLAIAKETQAPQDGADPDGRVTQRAIAALIKGTDAADVVAIIDGRWFDGMTAETPAAEFEPRRAAAEALIDRTLLVHLPDVAKRTAAKALLLPAKPSDLPKVDEKVDDKVAARAKARADRYNSLLQPLLDAVRIARSTALVVDKLAAALALPTLIVEPLLTRIMTAVKNKDEGDVVGVVEEDKTPRRALDVFLDLMAIKEPAADAPAGGEAPAEPVAAEADKPALIPLSRVPDQRDMFVRLHKTALILQRLHIGPLDLDWSVGRAADTGWLDVNALPVRDSDDPITITRWMRLADLMELRDQLPLGSRVLAEAYQLVLTPDAAADELLDRLLAHLSTTLQWNRDDLNDLVGPAGFKFAFPDDYKDEHAFRLLRRAFALLKRVGVRSSQARPWTRAKLTYDDGRKARLAVRARYSRDDWLEVGRRLRNELREKQRAALVDYLVVNPRDVHCPAGPPTPSWTNVNDLYGWLLIDVEMSPCFLTSRIRQAISSTQLFVQRCMMNLEPCVDIRQTVDICADNLTQAQLDAAANNDWSSWEWRKNYRVWEANLKVFLWPENYMLPELRDDKTPEFQALESRLMRGAMTSDAGVAAARRYLLDLLPLSRLEVMTIPDREYDHHIGRSPQTPYTYYHRRHMRAPMDFWTPWERIDVDIDAKQVLPALHNGRLHLFWTKAVVKTEERGAGEAIDSDRRQYIEFRLAWTSLQELGWLPSQLTDSAVDTHAVVEETQRKDAYIEEETWNREVYAGVTRVPTNISVASGDRLSISAIGSVRYGGLPGQMSSPSGTDVIAGSDFPLVGAPEICLIGWIGGGIKFTIGSSVNLDPAGASGQLYLACNDRYYSDNSGSWQSTITRRRPIAAVPASTKELHRLSSDPEHYTLGFDGGPGIGKVYVMETKNLQGHCREVGHFASTNCPASFTAVQPAVKDRTYAHGCKAGGTSSLDEDGAVCGFITVSDRSLACLETKSMQLGEPFIESHRHAVYRWEIFYHLPLFVADRLTKARQFESAQQWLHYIFNPLSSDAGEAINRYWVTQPLRMLSGEINQRIDEILDSESLTDATINSIARWRRDPFKPFLIARTRLSAFQKSVVMRYLDNLIAWGDDLFKMDTIESINEAAQIYILAYEILGRKPEKSEPRGNPIVRTFDQIDEYLNELSHARVEMTYDWPAAPLSGGGSRSDGPPGSEAPLPGIDKMLYFCIPRNENLIRYWETIEDRLFKIRHCQNIRGVVRDLPLMEPPIDPLLLIRARQQGIDIGSVLSDLYAGTPIYRFAYMVQKAIEFCNEVRGLGSTLLAALEKQDAEALAMLRSVHEQKMLTEVRTVKQKQIDEALAARDGIIETQGAATRRKRYHDENAAVLMNGLESDQQQKLEAAQEKNQEAQSYSQTASFLHAIPNFTIGTQFSFTLGGSNAGSATQAISGGTSAVAASISHIAATFGAMAGHTRRQLSDQLNVDTTQFELDQIEKQLVGAELRIAITERELQNHELQAEQTREIYDWMRDKFTNEDLYRWMGDQISEIYFQSFDLARTLAKGAERAMRNELGIGDDVPPFIQIGHFEDRKRGLLAGERLMHDLRRLEAAYIERNERDHELTGNISLAQLDPRALLELKSNRSCEFDIPEWLFDLRHPGHYMRRIRSVSLTIPCVTGPLGGVPCTLTHLSSQIRTSASTGDKYARQTDIDDKRFRDVIGAVQSIATSSGQGDTGLFETNLRDERYLPFENAGAISRWRLELPAALEVFDYNSITDVVLQVRYAARDGGDGLRKSAVDNVKARLKTVTGAGANATVALAQMISVRHAFPTEFHSFRAPRRPEDLRALDLHIGPEQFPYFTHAGKITIHKIDILATAVEKDAAPTLDIGRGGVVRQSVALAPLEGEGGLLTGTWAPFGGAAADQDWRIEAANDPSTLLSDLYLILHFTVTPVGARPE